MGKKNKDKNFIATTDRETANLLRELGFEEIESSGGRWVFINTDRIMFQDGVKNVSYTNVLHF